MAAPKLTEPAHSLLYAPQSLPPPAAPPDMGTLLDRVHQTVKKPLNARQQDAFRSSFQERLTILWGPPGTGKTATLAAMILGWLEHAWETGAPCAICVGSSNWNAIDNVLTSVARLLKARLTRDAGTMPTFIKRVTSASSQPRDDEGIDDVQRHTIAADVLRRDLNDLTDCLVVGSTWLQLRKLCSDKDVASAHAAEEDSDLSETPLEDALSDERVEPTTDRWFDLIVLDEASQVKVAEAAGYFLLAGENANVVLAGDHQQLGPVYRFQMQDDENGLLDCIYSYIHKTFEWTPVPLAMNYRTNAEISTWPRDRFYPEGYESFHPARRLAINLPTGTTAPDGWPAGLTWTDAYLRILDPDLPVAVITYPAQPYSVFNPFEAQTAVALACLYRLMLRRDGQVDDEYFWRERLGIVTPHRAQMSTVKNLLLDSAGFPPSPAPVVDTVDRFQGQERDMIIASYAVADRDFIAQEESFILSHRRFNVTLTRARSKFILLVSDAVVQYLPSDLQVARDAAHLQLFVENYCSVLDTSFLLPLGGQKEDRDIRCRLRGRH
jgi:hypothetical protein